AVLADGGPPEAGPDTRWEPDGMVGPRTHRALTVGWMPAGRRKTLEVWSSAERRPVLSTGLRSARWFRFSDDGRFLAVGTYDRAGVRVYDIASGGPVAMSALAPGDLATCGLPLPERRQRAMLPPGHVFATRPLNVQLVGLLPPQWQEAAAPWVVSAGMRSCDSMPPQVEASYRDQWQELPILAFAYSRPRRLWAVAISSSFGATESTRGIVLWDHDTHERLDALEGHTVFEPSRSGGRAPYVHSVAFGADGRYLISGGADGTVWVWDMRDRTAAATLTGHVGPVRYVAFGADGRRFVSGSEDGTVREWVIEGG
ncbi:hypothetical protein HOI71_10330, partial [Candidatus Poribacteria bacterium]|nr:hypothetical protein [Candidatus Poribacteria bacterium]